MGTQRAEAALSSEECSLSTMQGHWILAERAGGGWMQAWDTTSNIEDIKVRYM